MSHGTLTAYIESTKWNDKLELLYPDVLALNNKREIEFFKNTIGPNTNVKLLGDTRYDVSWIKKIEQLAKDTNSIIKPPKRHVILIIDRSFHNSLDSESARNSVHNDILNLLDDFEEIDLWYKAHPRYPGATKIKNRDRVKVFYNDIDSNYLLAHADTVISFTSGLLFQPIVNMKRVIYCDAWLKYCTSGSSTVFDNTKCVFKASNYKELKKGFLELKKNNSLEEDEVNKFYKKIVSGGISINKSIVDSHINALFSL